MQEILCDLKDKKEVDWCGHKVKSGKLSESYFRLGFENKAMRVAQCGTYLEFKQFINDLVNKRLYRANFCKVRLCPMCAWRRSFKIFGQTSQVMNYISDHYDYRYIFTTFSAKSVYAEELLSEIDKLIEAFHSLAKRKVFKVASKGWFRALEVTHDTDEFITRDMWFGNKERHIKPRSSYYKKLCLKIGNRNPSFDTYHPHFHIIIAVDKQYFKRQDLYISQEAWTDLWQSCLKVDYKPIVDVRVVKPVHGENDFGRAVAEVSKYAVKSADYIVFDEDGDVRTDLTDDAVYTLDGALANRRLVAFGGLFRDVHKMLNLDDAEDGDLVNTDNVDELRDDLNYVLVRYNWNIGIGNYIKNVE